MSAAVRAALAKHTCAFIDTGNTFSASRVAELAGHSVPPTHGDNVRVCAATPISSLSLLHRLILIWCINQSLNQSIKTEDAIGSALLRIRRYTAFDVFCLLQTLSDLYDALSALSSPLSKGEVQCNRDASFLGSLRLIVIDSLAAVISPILGGKANGMYAQ
jgi:hypothetical protein